MPEEGERRFPVWFHWLALPVQAFGLYLAIFTSARLLGVVLIVAGTFLKFYFAAARKPA